MRPNGDKLNQLIPATERLYAINPGFQPYLFYVCAPIVYLNGVAELPRDARYFLLAPRGKKETTRAKEEMARLDARAVLELSDTRGHHATVYQLARAD